MPLPPRPRSASGAAARGRSPWFADQRGRPLADVRSTQVADGVAGDGVVADSSQAGALAASGADRAPLPRPRRRGSCSGSRTSAARHKARQWIPRTLAAAETEILTDVAPANDRTCCSPPYGDACEAVSGSSRPVPSISSPDAPGPVPQPRGARGARPSGGQPADAQDRAYDLGCVVVNFVNVGTTYGKKVLKLGQAEDGGQAFHWEGVRRCVRHLSAVLGLRVIGVIFENWRGFDGLPEQLDEVCGTPTDILAMCERVEEAPRISMSHQRSADDEMTIKMAYRRNCRMLDNDNCRDWAKHHPDGKIRTWLKTCRRSLQMSYYFDSELGCFETLDGNGGAHSDGRASSSASSNGAAGRPAAQMLQPRSADAGGAQRVLLAEAGRRGASRRRSGRRAASSRRRSAPRAARAAEAPSQQRVFVEGLPQGTGWQELKGHMARAGAVEFVHVAAAGAVGDNPPTSSGWVLYASPEEACAAVALLDGTRFRGALIGVRTWLNRQLTTETS